MADITEIHSEITSRINVELRSNELDIKRWGEQFPNQMGFRRQVEIAHSSVGLATAQLIIDAVIAELAPPPAPPV